MTDQTCCLVLSSTYRDSVALMHLSRALEGLPDVRQAAVMMGTPHNKTLLREAGLLTAEGETAGVNDLLICVKAGTPAATERAVQEARQRLANSRAVIDDTGEMAPRTLETALRRMPDANLAFISIPGQYARHEVLKALKHGLHVFLFSDHVELEAEEQIKQLAAQQGLLVMGPDCGTAILGGIPLGFANSVSRGPVGLISASGTGLQEVICLLARQGIGISQAIGVGGRDLHRRIGGCSMRGALQALADDADTQVIVLISKPPDAEIAACLAREATQCGKPCVLAFLGDETRSDPRAALHSVSTLEDAALVAGALIRGETPVPSGLQELLTELVQPLEAARASLRSGQQVFRALYCGGTLAYEALWLLRRSLGKVDSNLDGTLSTSHQVGNEVIDLGAEEFTIGRPHPMIDPTVRSEQLIETARKPEVAVVLCDVILGWGAHPDPAAGLAAAWKEAQSIVNADGRNLVGIATVCGTPGDPQGYEEQCRVLREHGIILAESNAQAVRFVASVFGVSPEAERARSYTDGMAPVPPAPACDTTLPEVSVHLAPLFASGPRVINLGLELFATQLSACGGSVVHVDWRPPAGGNERLASLLERLR
ncbi:MAG: acyl-CoA synthetase FdrA [Candidatus Binatia bacterium]